MPSSRVFHIIPVVSPCAHIYTQHLVATRHSRSRLARRHTSTITSCSSVQRVYTPTRSSMRNAVTAQCVVESLLKSRFRGVGRWSTSSRRWLKDTTCTCELGICYPYFLCPSSQIKKPSLSTPMKQIYFQAPPQLEAATRPNLEKRVSELVPDGGDVIVTASTLPFSLSLRITYT